MHLMRERVDRVKESWYGLLGVLAYLGLPVLAAARCDAVDHRVADARESLRLSA